MLQLAHDFKVKSIPHVLYRNLAFLIQCIQSCEYKTDVRSVGGQIVRKKQILCLSAERCTDTEDGDEEAIQGGGHQAEKTEHSYACIYIQLVLMHQDRLIRGVP